MLYLRTGGNGSGKTLLTLKDVRDLQLKTGRPVCINIRPKDHPDKPGTPYCNIKPAVLDEFGWKLVEFKDWEAQEDGTIFLVDECHYDMPTRPASQRPPPHIQRLTEHRSRGFDFFLLTQHPKNIDSFVRNLVQAPGWHQHIKRQGGALPIARVMQWDAVELQAEKFGSGKNAQGKTRPYPREVYEWYDSAFIHTGKVRIPKQLLILGACVVAIPLLFAAGVGKVLKRDGADVSSSKPLQSVPSDAGGYVAGGGTPARSKTAAELIASYRPRIGGLTHTAPAYDELTKPKRVPVPAACVQMGERCSCYTQDATPYTTTAQICAQIVKGGLWLDFNPEGQQAAAAPVPASVPARQAPPAASQAPSGLVVIGDMPQTVAASPAANPAPDQPKPRVPKSSPWSFSTAGG